MILLTPDTMMKTDKKITKVKERIAGIEFLITSSLKQKTHNSAEINLPKLQRQLADLKQELTTLSK
jgi:hypothetical protein